MTDDVLSEFEPLIRAAEADDASRLGAEPSWRPWERTIGDELVYVPNIDLLVTLLSGPLRENATTQSGRLAKGFDAWMAYELRRAEFNPAEVWPRNTTPRVSSKEVEVLAKRLERLTSWLVSRDQAADRAASRLEDDGESTAVSAATERLNREHARLTKQYAKRQHSHAERVRAALADGRPQPVALPGLELPDRVPVLDALLPGLRATIQGVVGAMPNNNATNILGRFYVKQVDVVVASWERGPDVLISGKTMFSSFAKNTKNRYEETLGEASNLRDRYPLAGMGYAFLVSDKILDESGAYGRLQDLLLRTRKPYGPYDATLLLIATWDEATNTLRLADPLTYPDPTVSGQQPRVDLSASRFFTDLLNTVIINTPVGIHDEVRVLRNGTPIPGGTPDLNADAADEEVVGPPDDAGTDESGLQNEVVHAQHVVADADDRSDVLSRSEPNAISDGR